MEVNLLHKVTAPFVVRKAIVIQFRQWDYAINHQKKKKKFIIEWEERGAKSPFYNEIFLDKSNVN